MQFEAPIEYPFFEMAKLYDKPEITSGDWLIRTYTLDRKKI